MRPDILSSRSRLCSHRCSGPRGANDMAARHVDHGGLAVVVQSEAIPAGTLNRGAGRGSEGDTAHGPAGRVYIHYVVRGRLIAKDNLGGNVIGHADGGIKDAALEDRVDAAAAKVVFGDQPAANNIVDIASPRPDPWAASPSLGQKNQHHDQSSGGYNLTLDNNGKPAVIDVSGSHIISETRRPEQREAITGAGGI